MQLFEKNPWKKEVSYSHAHWADYCLILAHRHPTSKPWPTPTTGRLARSVQPAPYRAILPRLATQRSKDNGMPENVIAADRRSEQSRRITVVAASDGENFSRRANQDRRQGDDRRGYFADLIVADDAAVPDILKWLTDHADYSWTIGANNHQDSLANCRVRFFNAAQRAAFTDWLMDY